MPRRMWRRSGGLGLIESVGAGPAAIDTALFIYLIEEDLQYLSLIRPLLAQGEREIVTSAITLLEVLVVPYRAGNLALAERYEAPLTRGRGIRVELDRTQLGAAAQLRAPEPLTHTPARIQIGR